MSLPVRSLLIAALLALGAMVPGLASPAAQGGERSASRPLATPRPGGSVTGAANYTVTMLDFFFSPSALTINTGDTVTWTNNGFQTHTTSSATGGWASGFIPRGQSFVFTFNLAGTYFYTCTIYPQMTGSIQVLQGTFATPTPQPTFTPIPLPLGGRALGLQSGSGRMDWTGGALQTSYYIARWIPGGNATIIAAIGPASTSYTDPAPVNFQLNCYVVVPFATPSTYGLSDFLCRVPGLQAGQSAQNFTLKLNQTTTASLSWGAPPGVPITGYLLTIFNLDGTAARTQTLGAAATTATDDTQNKMTCYLLTARTAAGDVGISDVLCGMPGISTLGPNPQPTGGAGFSSLADALRALPRTLSR